MRGDPIPPLQLPDRHMIFLRNIPQRIPCLKGVRREGFGRLGGRHYRLLHRLGDNSPAFPDAIRPGSTAPLVGSLPIPLPLRGCMRDQDHLTPGESRLG